MNVVQFPREPEPQSLDAYRPGVLSETEEVRYVPMTEKQARMVENLGKFFLGQGAQETGTALLALYLGWQSGRRAG